MHSLRQTTRSGYFAIRTTLSLNAALFRTTAAQATNDQQKTDRKEELKNKLRAKTPIGKLDEHTTHPFQEKEPLKPWPNSTNPNTGEIGGPAGPEPTRYGDWERKGRVSDF